MGGTKPIVEGIRQWCLREIHKGPSTMSAWFTTINKENWGLITLK
jgi:hypothetical protein